MPTTDVDLDVDAYKLITEEAKFTASNASSGMQQWLFAADLPAPTTRGAAIPPSKGMRDTDGTGKLYGRGGGAVVIFT